MKTLVVIFLSVFIIGVQQVEAQTTTACRPVYGGGETCQQSENLSINKKVLNSNLTFQPGQTYQDSNFVDHIDTTNKPYTPNQQTAFRLFVTNTSTRDITSIKVEDILPPTYITYVSGQGTYDDKTRTFSATIERLKPNETKAITIQVMTARAEELPEGTNTICTVNQARASIGRDISEDNSQLCMNRSGQAPSPTAVTKETQTQTSPATKDGTTVPNQTKGGLPIAQTPQTQKTPDTGAEHLLLLTPLAGIGLYLRKKASFLT